MARMDVKVGGMVEVQAVGRWGVERCIDEINKRIQTENIRSGLHYPDFDGKMRVYKINSCSNQNYEGAQRFCRNICPGKINGICTGYSDLGLMIKPYYPDWDDDSNSD